MELLDQNQRGAAQTIARFVRKAFIVEPSEFNLCFDFLTQREIVG